MAAAVLTMSVHPIISPQAVDDHVYDPSGLDLSGLAQTIEDVCRGGNPLASVRIADSYLDLDAVDELKHRIGNVQAVEALGGMLLDRASVRGKSRNGVITVADEWNQHLKKDVEGPQLVPSVFFILVRASTSLMVGDWLHQALARFDSFSYPPGMIEAFTGGKAKSQPSAGRLPREVGDKLEAMFGLPFQHHAKLNVICRKS